MRDQGQARVVTDSGSDAEGVFALSMANQVHLMKILRDALYTDKILAVLREYASNAWDAHRSVGKDRLPIKVALPTTMSPTLVIRDFGPGLSDQDVFDLYPQYGSSTKRQDDNTVGTWGLGSKSAFCYSDTFTVTSFYGGVRTVYVAVLEESDQGAFKRFHSEPCGDETGLEIQIPVRDHDIPEFERKAISLFRHFDPRPDINVALPEESRMGLPSGYILENADPKTSSWVAVMGCVPYRVDMTQIKTTLQDIQLWNAVSGMSGGLSFKIGEVEISASREELKYSDDTKQKLVERVALLYREFADETLRTLEDPSITDWTKRLRVRLLLDKCSALRFVLPRGWAGFMEKQALLPLQDLFTARERDFSRRFHVTDTIGVSPKTLLVCKDSPNLYGYKLPDESYVLVPVRCKPKLGREEFRKALDGVLQEAQLTGIPVKYLSEFPFSGGTENLPIGDPNPKHKAKVFVLNGERLNTTRPHSKRSQYWNIVERTPEPEDVYAVIRPHFNSSVYYLYRTDYLLANHFGWKLPTVYGYKDSESLPKDAGIEYSKWREKFYAARMKEPEFLDSVHTWMWAEIIYLGASSDSWLKIVTEDLGSDHLISAFLNRREEAVKAKKEAVTNTDIRNALHDLITFHTYRTEDQNPYLDIFKNPAEEALKGIKGKYPLLGVCGLDGLCKENQWAHWIGYIKLVDERA